MRNLLGGGKNSSTDISSLNIVFEDIVNS